MSAIVDPDKIYRQAELRVSWSFKVVFKDLFNDKNDKYNEAIELFNKAGNMYQLKKQYDLAGHAYYRSYQCNAILDNKIEMSSDLRKSANCYRLVDIDRALNYYQQSINIDIQNNRFKSAIDTYIYLGNYYESKSIGKSNKDDESVNSSLDKSLNSSKNLTMLENSEFKSESFIENKKIDVDMENESSAMIKNNSDMKGSYTENHQDNMMDNAIECYKKALELSITDERLKSNNSRLYEKLSNMYINNDQYVNAIEMFEKIAQEAIDCTSIISQKYATEKALYHAALCHLASGDFVSTKRAIQMYMDMDPSLSSSPKFKFIHKILGAFDSFDVALFNGVVAEYNGIYKLTDIEVHLLLAIRNVIENDIQL